MKQRPFHSLVPTPLPIIYLLSLLRHILHHSSVSTVAAAGFDNNQSATTGIGLKRDSVAGLDQNLVSSSRIGTFSRAQIGSHSSLPISIQLAAGSEDSYAVAMRNLRHPRRMEMDVPAELLNLLRSRGELGYRRNTGSMKLELVTTEIDCKLLRKAIKSTFGDALRVRLFRQEDCTLSDADINTEAEEISFATAEMAMTAIYAKLHTIFKGHNPYSSRYTSEPSYTDDIELPLPIALAIQDLGTFETACLAQNYLAAPTYPQGTENEGRESDEYPLADYQSSYLPAIKSLGIPCKAVNTTVKAGSPWWTYNVRTLYGTSDLVATLPMSLYSDFSTELRSIFLASASETDSDSFNFMKIAGDARNYGVRLREMPPGSNVRAFLALCHGPEEEWSLGPI